ncbi:MAG: hypothetical protein AAB229_10595 [Candidatus Hydrogenedentota bacterium]
MTKEELQQAASGLVTEDNSFIERLRSRVKNETRIKQTLKRMEATAMKIAGKLPCEDCSPSRLRAEVRQLKEAALRR